MAGVRRVTASNTKVSGVSARYAQALFDLARDSGETERVRTDLIKLGELIAGSDDLARFIASPLYDAEEQIGGLAGVLEKMKASQLTIDFVKTVTRNRRLPLLPEMIEAYRALVTQMNGEITAQIISAAKLTAAQNKKIASALKSALGSSVKIENTVDPSIMGGLVVRVGSRMIDTSIKTRLNTLKMMLKGA